MERDDHRTPHYMKGCISHVLTEQRNHTLFFVIVITFVTLITIVGALQTDLTDPVMLRTLVSLIVVNFVLVTTLAFASPCRHFVRLIDKGVREYDPTEPHEVVIYSEDGNTFFSITGTPTKKD